MKFLPARRQCKFERHLDRLWSAITDRSEDGPEAILYRRGRVVVIGTTRAVFNHCQPPQWRVPPYVDAGLNRIELTRERSGLNLMARYRAALAQRMAEYRARQGSGLPPAMGVQ